MAEQRKSIFIRKENRTNTEKLVNSIFYKSIAYCDIQNKDVKTEKDVADCQKFMRDLRYLISNNYEVWLNVNKIMWEKIEECLSYYNSKDVEFIRKVSVKCQKEKLGKDVKFTEEEEDFASMIKGVKAMSIVSQDVNARLENDPDCPKNNRASQNFDKFIDNNECFEFFNYLYNQKEKYELEM